MTEADEAAHAFGGVVQRLVQARENAVYEIRVPQGRAALRLHRAGYQTEAAIRSELWWCGALHAAGVAAPEPIRTPGGEVLIALVGGRLASVMAWVEGVPLGAGGEALSGTVAEQCDRYRALGRLLAEVHGATDAMTMPPLFTRPRWDIDGLLGEAPFWGRFWEHPGLTSDEAALARRCRDFLRERLGDHQASGDFGLIHADALRENVIVNDRSCSLIDFDDCGTGFRLYDLGTALVQNLAEPALPAIAEALCDGYGGVRRIDPGMLAVFTLMRCWASVGWTISRLAARDPINRSHIGRAMVLAERMLSGRAVW